MKILIIYLIIINIITFAVFAWDKLAAIKGQWRVRESTLLGLTFIGGSLGALAAMLLARHKIRKPTFAVGVPFALVIHMAFVIWMIRIK